MCWLSVVYPQGSQQEGVSCSIAHPVLSLLHPTKRPNLRVPFFTTNVSTIFGEFRIIPYRNFTEINYLRSRKADNWTKVINKLSFRPRAKMKSWRVEEFRYVTCHLQSGNICTLSLYFAFWLLAPTASVTPTKRVAVSSCALHQNGMQTLGNPLSNNLYNMQ